MLDKRTTCSARFMHRIMTAMMIVLALLIFPSLGGAAIITVSDGNDIQNAIDAAVDFDTIRLVGPEFLLPSNEVLTVDYKNLTFIGDNTKTTVRGNGSGVFEITSSIVTMENLIITGGDQVEFGAGIAQSGGSLTLKKCEITQNGSEDVSWGGALFSFFCSVTIQDCLISENCAESAPGIYADESTLTIKNSEIKNNTLGLDDSFTADCETGEDWYEWGGGVNAWLSYVNIEDTLIEGNDNILGGGLGITDSSLDLTRVTVVGNTSYCAGGGIYTGGAVLNLVDSMISENTSLLDGGGICMDSGMGSIISTTISKNAAGVTVDGWGGGIDLNGVSKLDISKSNIQENVAGHFGGGIYSWYSDASISQSTISNNKAGNGVSGAGGGIFLDFEIDTGTSDVYFSQLEVTSSTISGNTAIQAGGGIWVQSSDMAAGDLSHALSSSRFRSPRRRASFANVADSVKVTPDSCTGSLIGMKNSTISGNSAQFSGGGLAVGGAATIDFCTITDNASEEGGGIYSDQLSIFHFGSNIIAGNKTYDGLNWSDWFAEDVTGAELHSNGGNLIGDNTGSPFDAGSPNAAGDYVGSVAQPVDPLLEALADNGGLTKTHALTALSPAIALAAACIDTDQRGYGRPYPENTNCDSGAYEFLGEADLSLSKTVNDPEPDVGDNIVYTVAVSNSNQGRAVAVNVVDLLPIGLTYQSHDADVGTYNHLTGIWDVGDLAPAGIQELEIIARVDLPGTITNTATAFAANSTSPAPTAQADIEVAPDPAQALYLIKTVSDSTPLVGDQVVYSLSVVYFGDVPGQGVVVTDQLPAGVTHISDDGGGSYTPSSGEWAVGTMQPTTARQLKITVLVNQAGQITNEATADAASTGVAQVNASADLDASETAIGTLTMTKTVDNQTPRVGEQIVFTLVAANGSQNEIKDVRIIEQLPTGLTYESDDSGNAYDPVTGIWTIGDLPAGESRELNITVTPALVGVITNTATIYSASGGAKLATGNAYVIAWEGKKGSGGGGGGCFLECLK